MSLRQFAWIFSVLILSHESSAQNADIKDYTVPVSTVHNLRADFSFNYAAEGGDLKGRSGSLAFTYKRFREGLFFAYSLDAIGSGALNRDVSSSRDTSQYASDVDLRGKKYILWGTSIFAFSDVNFDYDKAFDQPSTRVTVGAGNGRFIDATSLARAVRVEAFLIREDAISDHLPKEDLIELGHVIEKEREFKERYGSTYKKWWFEEMERVIVGSGVVPKGIGAGGILRINEVLFQERVNNRFYGKEFSFGVSFQTTASHRGIPRGDPSASADYRYSLPLGWRIQFNQRLELNSPFTRRFGRVYTAGLISDFVYEVSNRIDISIQDILRAERNQTGQSKVGTSFGALFSFFLENKTNFVVGVQVDKSEGLPWTRSFTSSLNYRLL